MVGAAAACVCLTIGVALPSAYAATAPNSSSERAIAGVETAVSGTPVASPTATPTATPTPTPTPTPAPTPPITVPPVVKPVVLAPRHSGTGRRIVYSRAYQHVWLVDSRNAVVRDFPVSGRTDWPRKGAYRVQSKSTRSSSTTYHVTFRWMVRFAFGHRSWIGFHTIPRYRNGRLMHSTSKLGKAVGRGGCPHSLDANAKYLYRHNFLLFYC